MYKKGDVVIHTIDNKLYKIKDITYWNGRKYYTVIGSFGHTLVDANLLYKKSDLRRKKLQKIKKIVKNATTNIY